MLMNVLPGACRGDREMYAHFLEADWLTLNDLDDQWLNFGSDPGMNPSFAAHQGGDAEGTPNTRSPPARTGTLNPVRSWSRRKRVNDPWFAYVRVQNNSVDFRQLRKELLNLGNRHVEAPREFGSVRAAAGINETLNQFVMDKR
jgi:hypothetical protein